MLLQKQYNGYMVNCHFEKYFQFFIVKYDLTFFVFYVAPVKMNE